MRKLLVVVDMQNDFIDGSLGTKDCLLYTSVVSYEQDGTAVAAPTKAGTYKVVVTAGENGDYEGIASGQPTYTIAKKTITASLNGTLTKTYDGTTKVLEAQKLTVLLKGVEDGDKVTATADAYAYNSAEVKAADTITGSVIALAGADAENYQLAETKASVSAKILQKNLAKADVTLGAALVANGKSQTQAVEKVMLDGTELTAKDYEVTGNQAAAAGSYTLTIEGKNNYTGKVPVSYTHLDVYKRQGLMSVLHADVLLFDREDIRKLFQEWEVPVTDSELSGVTKESIGHPLGVVITIRHMAEGQTFGPELVAGAFREVFRYFETAIYKRFDLNIRRFLLELAPFEQFDLDMARIVSGDPRVGEMLDWLQRNTTMLRYDETQRFHFWPQFRAFLMWEMDRDCLLYTSHADF